MYRPQFYAGKSQEEIKKDIEKQGFRPIIISDTPGFVYHQHQHPEAKLLVFLKGSMDVITEGKTFHCLSGDSLFIPGNTPHEAIVGENGCTFFWSEKII